MGHIVAQIVGWIGGWNLLALSIVAYGPQKDSNGKDFDTTTVFVGSYLFATIFILLAIGIVYGT